MIRTPLVSLTKVGCRFRVKKGRFKVGIYDALKDVSLDIYQGEKIGILGRNGAGKSSILRIISGIILPNTGKVTIQKNTSISLLSLQAGFSVDLSGRDNAILGAMLMGYTKKQSIKRLDHIIEFSELEDWINEPVKTYSTGMRARLGFAVAMELSPDILLVDEVFAVGDEAFSKKSIHAMQNKLKSDQTFVFVSHQLPLLQTVCSRLIWIDDGKVVVEGDPDFVINSYQKSFL